MEKVLCAAIWYEDFEMPVHSPKNITHGVVLCGYRHAHVIGQMLALTGKRSIRFGEGTVGDYVQGFLTSENRFLNRQEAHALFVKNGGTPNFDDELYSEDLY